MVSVSSRGHHQTDRRRLLPWQGVLDLSIKRDGSVREGHKADRPSPDRSAVRP